MILRDLIHGKTTEASWGRSILPLRRCLPYSGRNPLFQDKCLFFKINDAFGFQTSQFGGHGTAIYREKISQLLPIKSDGKSEPFDEAKLRRSLMHALQKRPVTQEQIETVLSDIQLQIRRLGERDVKSRTIGEIVMQALFALDHVAYVRFASVYQDFQDVEAFRRQIEQMQLREQ